MSETQVYNEYPITLAHPHFTPSKAMPIPGSQVYGQDGEVIRQDYQGTQQRFPPVTARDEREEDYYTAQGYQRAGKVDPAAWVKAHSDPPPEDYKPQQYPKWGSDAEGRAVLYMSAQDDPDATPEDLAPPVKAEAPEPAPAPGISAGEADNLRAMLAQVNEQMRQLTEDRQASQKREAELAAQLAEASAQPPAQTTAAPSEAPRAKLAAKPRGRPRKAA